MPENPSTELPLTRRLFMTRSAAGLSIAWAGLHWPAVLSAAEHAHHAVSAPVPPKFEFFTADEAKEVDAITSRIIPTDDTPGAHEAGVVYFVDRALVTFAKENQKLYRDGLEEIQSRVREIHPGVKFFSAATTEHQDAILESFDKNASSGGRLFRQATMAPDFFDIIRQHTIAGFLIAPDSGREGNRDGVGWKVIGRGADHGFQPPFGFYDKDYPGWQPNPVAAEKK